MAISRVRSGFLRWTDLALWAMERTPLRNILSLRPCRSGPHCWPRYWLQPEFLLTMIAKLFPEAYDVQGRPTFRPDQRHRGRFPATFPIGRYVTQPLTIKCQSLEDLRR